MTIARQMTAPSGFCGQSSMRVLWRREIGKSTLADDDMIVVRAALPAYDLAVTIGAWKGLCKIQGRDPLTAGLRLYVDFQMTVVFPSGQKLFAIPDFGRVLMSEELTMRIVISDGGAAKSIATVPDIVIVNHMLNLRAVRPNFLTAGLRPFEHFIVTGEYGIDSIAEEQRLQHPHRNPGLTGKVFVAERDAMRT